MDDDEDLPRLEFYWEEPRPGEDIGDLWGELAGSTHRLLVVRDELDELEGEADIDRALTRLAYHIENYLVRVYELRDRCLGLLAAFTGQPKAVDALRHPDKRESAIHELSQQHPEATTTAAALIKLLHEDILLRNQHTHRQFLRLGLYTGSDVYDPSDALVDLKRDPAAWERVTGILRREISRLVTEYGEKVGKVSDLTRAFLTVTDSAARASLRG